MDETIQEGNGVKRKWIIGGIAIAILIVAIIGFEIYFQTPQTVESESRISQVLENPNAFYGQQVSLVGPVEEVLGSRVFTLDAPEPFSDKLLVISKNPLQPIGASGTNEFLFARSDRVSVKGTVNQFNLREVENQLGEDLLDSQFINWEGKPVIIADTVEREL